MKKIFLAAIFTVLLPALKTFAYDQETPLPDRSQMQTHLRLEVKDETRAIHFINTNNDPDIFTKTYVLKHADPYELRPYIRNTVDSRRVNTSQTKVEAIKYEDGTGILIVSAEDYRFDRQEIGMGIDEIVETLDLPNVSSSSGHKLYLYFPKYWDSQSLSQVIKNVGMANANSPYELQGGKDRVSVDTGLNAMFFYTPKYSIKHIERMLELYDTPTSEALIKYTIYEMDYENDGNIGVDFQAWKNGPGSDLFAAGARYTNGWDIANMAVSPRPYYGVTRTSFINFSPKWNTKYLDFLVAKSKAKVVTTGELSVMTNQQAHIENTTRLVDIERGAEFSDKATLNEYIKLNNAGWDDGTGAAAANNGNYRARGITEDGNAFNLVRDDGTAVNANINFVITRSTVNGNTYYYMEVGEEFNAFFIDSTGRNWGRSIKCLDGSLQQCARTVQGVSNGAIVYSYGWTTVEDWQTDRSYSIQRDAERISHINQYGFEMTVTPTVSELATELEIYMSNTNLIGFSNTGAPRTSLSELNTQVMVNNKGQKFVIGGLDKKEIVRSVSKVPWLGSIPILGWAFGSESEVVKTSQLVAVIECRPMMPDTKPAKEITRMMSEVDEKIDNYGIKYGVIDQDDFGFDQFWLDKDKKELAPLP